MHVDIAIDSTVIPPQNLCCHMYDILYLCISTRCRHKTYYFTDHVCREHRHIRAFQRDASAEGGLGSAKCTMKKMLQSNRRILYSPTFQRNASTFGLGHAGVYEMHYGENVVI